MNSLGHKTPSFRRLRKWLLLTLLGALSSCLTLSLSFARECTIVAFSESRCDELQMNYRLYGLSKIFRSDLDPAIYLQLQLETSHELSFYSGTSIATLAGHSLIDSPRAASDVTPDQLVLFSGLQISIAAVAPENLSTDFGWVSEVGTIGEIGVKMEFIKSILKLLSDKQSLPSGKSDALNLIVNGWELVPYLRLQGQSTLALDEQLRPYLSNVTIRLNTEFLNSLIGSETKLDPKDWQVLVEKVQIKVGLGGSTSLSGETIFERGQGLTSQIFTIESAVDNIRLSGQAIFTPTSQEFRIGASICDLAFTGTSLITATGQIQQSFGFQLKFGGLPPPSPTTTEGSCRSP